MLDWFTGRPAHVAKRNGIPGSFVVLADFSSSMLARSEDLRMAFAATKRAFPTARIFVFADRPTEWRPGMGLCDDSIGGGTAMHRGIDLISPLMPEKTLIISDGGTNHKAAFRAAARLTGAIDTICCTDSECDRDEDADRDFMIALARRNGGRSRKYVMYWGAERLLHLMQLSHVEVPTGIVVHHHFLPPEHV